jgi:hypothetical protein
MLNDQEYVRLICQIVDIAYKYWFHRILQQNRRKFRRLKYTREMNDFLVARELVLPFNQKLHEISTTIQHNLRSALISFALSCARQNTNLERLLSFMQVKLLANHMDFPSIS